MAVQRDFVANLGFGVVNPGVRDVRQHLPFEIRLDVFLERHAFGVPEIGVRFRVAVAVAANLRRFVPLAKRGHDGFDLGRIKADIAGAVNGLQFREKFRAVLERLLPGLLCEFAQQGADDFLPLPAGLNFLEPDFFVLLGAGGKVAEPAFIVQPGDALLASLEIQAQGAFDCDLVEAEILICKNLADDQGLFLTVNSKLPGLSVLEIAKDFGDFGDVVRVFFLVGGVADAAALVAQTFFHLHPEVAGVEKLDFAFALLFLPVGENPKVCRDARIVKKLFRLLSFEPFRFGLSVSSMNGRNLMASRDLVNLVHRALFRAIAGMSAVARWVFWRDTGDFSWGKVAASQTCWAGLRVTGWH
jgi:hypothetical protein